MTKFSGYVLAGGKSSRMRTDKAFLESGGETFVQRAVQTLSAVCENRVKVVLNSSQIDFIERLPEHTPPIFDKFENRGAAGGIHAALSDCQTENAIILAVDLPLVTTDVIQKIAALMLSSSELTAVVPRQFDGKLQPLCAVYSVNDCLPVLENLLNEKDSVSVRDFLKLIATRIVEQKELSDENADIFFNVNHPADFQRIK